MILKPHNLWSGYDHSPIDIRICFPIHGEITLKCNWKLSSFLFSFPMECIFDFSKMQLIFLMPDISNISQCGSIHKNHHIQFFIEIPLLCDSTLINVWKPLKCSSLLVVITKMLFPFCYLSSDQVTFPYICIYSTKSTVWTGLIIFHIWIL